MKIPKATARLTALVQKCGRPEAVTLWSKPSSDPHFQKAIEQNRVLTIMQRAAGSRKDFGVVGFHRGKSAAYWVFPKPLTEFDDKKIIGIDYSMLRAPELKPAEQPPARARVSHRKAAPRPPAEPKPPEFQVTIRCTAIVDVVQTVAAKNRQQAREKALAALAREKVDFTRGTQARKAVRAEPVRRSSLDMPERFRRLGRLPGELE